MCREGVILCSNIHFIIHFSIVREKCVCVHKNNFEYAGKHFFKFKFVCQILWKQSFSTLLNLNRSMKSGMTTMCTYAYEETIVWPRTDNRIAQLGSAVSRHNHKFEDTKANIANGTKIHYMFKLRMYALK